MILLLYIFIYNIFFLSTLSYSLLISLNNEKELILNFFSQYDNNNSSLILPKWVIEKNTLNKLNNINYEDLLINSNDISIQRYLSGRNLLENLIKYDIENDKILKNKRKLRNINNNEDINEEINNNFRRLNENIKNKKTKNSKNKILSSDISNNIESWKKYEEVDGFKNERVAILVTSTVVKTHMMWERIIPASRTWMKGFKNVFVVIEDNILSRYSLRHCKVEEYPKNTIFICPNEPIYVLSRECTSDYYGGNGPCCKVDELFSFIANDYQNGEFINKIDYIFHGDDDTYYRPDQILRFLSKIEKSGISDFPLVGNATPTRTYNGGGIWHVSGCNDIASSGWYQPIMLNKAALLKMRKALKSYGLKDTCSKFYVTHDVGLEVFVWLFSLYHIELPETQINPSHRGFDILHPTQMIVHNLRFDSKDKCRGDDFKEWPPEKRYKQKVVIGCGDVDETIPFHNKEVLANFYDAYNYFQENGRDVVFTQWNELIAEVEEVTPKNGQLNTYKIKKFVDESKLGSEHVIKVSAPYIEKINGYENTKHSKEHNIVNKWETFKPEDCSDPGHVNGF